MIITRLKGGLGNQLFQYCTGRALARRHETELTLDFSSLRFEGRRNELVHFAIAATGASRWAVLKHEGPRLRLPLLRYLDFSRASCVREPHFHYDPGFESLPDDVMIDGYWQSPRYFEDHWDLLRRELRIVTPASSANRAMAARIAAQPAAAIHLRRGDYVSNPESARRHGLPPLAYTREAMARIRSRVPGVRFFLFSDQPARAWEELAPPSDVIAVDQNAPDRGVEDLRLMALCDHFVIANSSFSWWGAWLGAHAHSLVFAPKQWFLIPEMNTDDLIPGSWVRL